MNSTVSAPGAIPPLRVALVAWPTEAALRDALAARGQPRVLVVTDGEGIIRE